MSMFSPKTISFDTSVSEIDLAGEATLLIIKNDGAGNAYIAFYNNANTSVAPVNSGETISFDLGANNIRGVKKLSVIGSGAGTLRIWGALKDE